MKPHIHKRDGKWWVCQRDGAPWPLCYFWPLPADLDAEYRNFIAAVTRWGSVEAAACSFLRVGYWWLDGVFLAETCRAHIARRYGMTPEQFGPVAALFADAYVDELVAEVRRAYGLPTNGN